jgi:serine/threonine protein kinase
MKCYHGGLCYGSFLLLGRRIGKGGFAEVYEASPVEILSHGGDLQVYRNAVAAAATAGAAAAGASLSDGPLVRVNSSLKFAVKVPRRSRDGVSEKTIRKLAAGELHALQLLRGWLGAVQLMAEGELEFLPCDAALYGSLSGLSSSALAAAAGKCSREEYQLGCIVMELGEETLHDVVRRLHCSGQMFEAFAQAVAAQLLELVQVMQSGQLGGYVITHRDLKPANILLMSGGRLAVADYGACHIRKVAGVAGAAAAAAAEPMHTAIGSRFYAAPEVWVSAGPAAAAIPAVSPKPSSAAQRGGLNIQPSSSKPQPDGLNLRMIQPSSSTPQPGGLKLYVTSGLNFQPSSSMTQPGDLNSQPSSSTAQPTGLNIQSSSTALLAGLDSQQDGSNATNSGAPSYTSSVDVFAVGVIVLETLVGRLSRLFGPGELTTAQMMQQWEQQLGRVVDGEVALPDGVVLSPLARQFISCCCGVGRARQAAAARGEPKRLSPAELCNLPFIVTATAT